MLKVKALLKYPLSYLFILLFGFTTYDYFNHINRSGSVFEKYPLHWLLFSVAAFLSFVLTVLFFKYLLQRFFQRSNLIIEVIAIGLWIVLYLLVIGPILDKLFWPYGDLQFNFKLGPFVIIMVIYFSVRLLLNIITGHKALYSK